MEYLSYIITQNGKDLISDKIAINKYDNKISKIIFNLDGTIVGRLYFAMKNPKTEKYFFLPLQNNEIVIGTNISVFPGMWKSILVGVEDDYEIIDNNINQSKTTFVSNELSRIIVRDNFLDEEFIEPVSNPAIDATLEALRKAQEQLENAAILASESANSASIDKAEIHDIFNQINQMNEDIILMKSQVEQYLAEVKNNAFEVENNKTDVIDLHNQVTQILLEVQSILSDIQVIKNQIDQEKTDIEDIKSYMDDKIEIFENDGQNYVLQSKRWAVGDETIPESIEDNAKYYAEQTKNDATQTFADRTTVTTLTEHVDTVAMQVDADKTETSQYKEQAVQSAAEALISEQNAKSSETVALEAKTNTETAKEQAELFAQQTSLDKTDVETDKTIVLQARDETVSAKNTAIENANISINSAEETEADRAEVAQNKLDVAQLKSDTEQIKQDTLLAEQRVIQLMSTDTKSYFFATLAERDAATGIRHCDRCSVLETRADYIYDDQDVDGNSVNPEWIKTSDWDALKTVAWDIITGKPNFATVATSGKYGDLLEIPNRYCAPIVLDSSADTIEWDYSLSDTAIVTLDSDKPLVITNGYNGCQGIIIAYNGKLIFDDTIFRKSATFNYIEAVDGEYTIYSFVYFLDKWSVSSTIMGGDGDVS